MPPPPFWKNFRGDVYYAHKAYPFYGIIDLLCLASAKVDIYIYIRKNGRRPTIVIGWKRSEIAVMKFVLGSRRAHTRGLELKKKKKKGKKERIKNKKRKIENGTTAPGVRFAVRRQWSYLYGYLKVFFFSRAESLRGDKFEPADRPNGLPSYFRYFSIFFFSPLSLSPAIFSPPLSTCAAVVLLIFALYILRTAGTARRRARAPRLPPLFIVHPIRWP